LADAGIPLGCQTVLLRGVNDEPAVMIDLMRGLLAMAVRPYYLFQLDWVRGASHFRTPITRGMEIMDALQASLGGLGLPQYVLDLPGGGGKVPLWPLLPHPAVRDSQGCAGPGDLV
jgi:lysine 2,3-aminomutase